MNRLQLGVILLCCPDVQRNWLLHVSADALTSRQPAGIQRKYVNKYHADYILSVSNIVNYELICTAPT